MEESESEIIQNDVFIKKNRRAEQSSPIRSMCVDIQSDSIHFFFSSTHLGRWCTAGINVGKGQFYFGPFFN